MKNHELKWKINQETIEECLRQAFNTYASYLEDMGIHEQDESEWLNYCDLFSYKNCHDKIRWIPITEINAETMHYDSYEVFDENELYGIIVIMNDDIVIDGNHRYNTIHSKYSDNEDFKNLKVPVLNIYYEF